MLLWECYLGPSLSSSPKWSECCRSFSCSFSFWDLPWSLPAAKFWPLFLHCVLILLKLKQSHLLILTLIFGWQLHWGSELHPKVRACYVYRICAVSSVCVTSLDGAHSTAMGGALHAERCVPSGNLVIMAYFPTVWFQCSNLSTSMVRSWAWCKCGGVWEQLAQTAPLILIAVCCCRKSRNKGGIFCTWALVSSFNLLNSDSIVVLWTPHLTLTL